MKPNKTFAHYPNTKFFQVIDIIPQDHFFTLTDKHFNYASDNHFGLLSSDCIREMEEKTGKPSCGHPDCNFFYDEHLQALLVAVTDNGLDLTDVPGFNEFYSSALMLAQSEGYINLFFTKRSLVEQYCPEMLPKPLNGTSIS